LGEAAGGPAEAVEAPHHDPGDPTILDAAPEFIPSFSVHRLARALIPEPEDLLISGGLRPPLEVRELTGRVLALGADAGVDRGRGHRSVPFRMCLTPSRLPSVIVARSR